MARKETVMVRIVQLLCPERHCLMGMAYKGGDSDFKNACDTIRTIMKEAGFNSWCGICGSHELHFEEKDTRFSSLAEASPFLNETMLANAKTRAALDAAGLSYDKAREN